MDFDSSTVDTVAKECLETGEGEDVSHEKHTTFDNDEDENDSNMPRYMYALLTEPHILAICAEVHEIRLLFKAYSLSTQLKKFSGHL